MIKGEWIALRPVESADLPAMRRWFDDRETMRHWGRPRPFVTEREFEADLSGRFSHFQTEGYFTVVDPNGEPIGRIDYSSLDARNRSCQLSILIGEEWARGRRYGADAIVALLRHLFHDRNLHRVELTVLVWNERAIRAYRRIGFREEGTLRDYRFVDGGYVDELQMSILRHEFDAIHVAGAEAERPPE